jgi:hypothetical protein
LELQNNHKTRGAIHRLLIGSCASKTFRLRFGAVRVMNRHARITRRKGTTTMKNTASTAIQTAAVADQGAHVAPEKATSKRKASKTKGAPKGQKPASKTAANKSAKPASDKAPKAKDAAVPREFSKKAIVLDLLRRKDGATIAEIAKATDWLNHSIRGFISGTISKRMGLVVESTKTEAGDRRYKVAAK